MQWPALARVRSGLRALPRRQPERLAGDAHALGRFQREVKAIAALSHPNILTIYEVYREKKPVMLFDMQEQRIYVYPYLDFKHDLSERSQRLLQDQYEQAMTDDKIVVFVRDNDAKKLVSYTV